MQFKTSKDSYNDAKASQSYIDFLETQDGQTFQDIIYGAIRDRLDSDTNQQILDAACGPGWLTARLANEFPNVQGLDGSKPFLKFARERYPDLTFVEGDLNSTLPYSEEQFSTIIMSMAAHDVEDQVKTFTELKRIIKPGGQLILTITNPYYAFPVGSWKRGLFGRLFNKKPKLVLKPYHWFSKSERDYSFYEGLESYFYKFSEHLNNLKKVGFDFEYMSELESLEDDANYSMKYRLHRFPIIVLLDFKKE